MMTAPGLNEGGGGGTPPLSLTKPNRYQAGCHYCARQVGAEAGTVERHGKRWLVWHLECRAMGKVPTKPPAKPIGDDEEREDDPNESDEDEDDEEESDDEEATMDDSRPAAQEPRGQAGAEGVIL